MRRCASAPERAAHSVYPKLVFEWARVGSTNRNIATWLGNRELDVVVEDETFAREMEEM